jgi:multiple antibiotic resistance protein
MFLKLMTITEIAILLFLVIDPFGNMPIIVSILSNLDDRQYKRAIIREITFGFFVITFFLFLGDSLLSYLNIKQGSLSIAGGIILFLISLKMIFAGSGEIFKHEYDSDPWFVPIAVPSIAGPSALTTVILLKSDPKVSTGNIIIALAIIFIFSLLFLYFSRSITRKLGPKFLRALERFMGMLLNLISVNMIMDGIKSYF